jgi:hypothetical protein
LSTSQGFGPEFQDARSRLYRSEYAAISIALLGYLVWRALYFGLDVSQTVFWAIFPDLASFVPIGLSSKRKEWPGWGANLYNAFHTILVWGGFFAAIWLLLRVPDLPLLGWLGHITADRALGYGLRRSQRPDVMQNREEKRLK